MLSRVTFAGLIALSCLHCTKSSVLLQGDGGMGDVSSPDVMQDTTVVPPGDGSPSCDDAPLLPNDATWPDQVIGTAVAPMPLPESCYDGLLNPSLYYRLEVPPGIGVEVSVEAAPPQRPDVSFADACRPATGQERCEYWQTSSRGPSATEFISNSTGAPLTVLVRVSFEEPLDGLATISTQSVVLGDEILCDRAPVLAPDVVVTTGRGNVIDNCDFSGERVFHTLEIPPRSLAEPVSPAVASPGAWSCACDNQSSLRNTSDALSRINATTPALREVGWTATALESNQSCETPLMLDPGPAGPTQTMMLGGDPAQSCAGASLESPLYYQVNVPTQQRAIVTATPSNASGDSLLELEARRLCGSPCEASASGLAIRDIELTIDNPGTGDTLFIVTVANTADRLRSAQVQLQVRTEPL